MLHKIMMLLRSITGMHDAAGDCSLALPAGPPAASEAVAPGACICRLESVADANGPHTPGCNVRLILNLEIFQ